MAFVKLAAASLSVALALGVAACGGDDPGGDGAHRRRLTARPARSLTIYSSLPLQGASRVQSEATVNGAKLALEQAGGKAGPHTITYEPLDDSTAQAASWTPEAESANALKASQNESTAVYIGTLNSGAAKVSIPILNEAQVPMISPANTVRRADHGRPRAPSPASRTSTTRPASATTPASCPRTRSRAPRS